MFHSEPSHSSQMYPVFDHGLKTKLWIRIHFRIHSKQWENSEEKHTHDSMFVVIRGDNSQSANKEVFWPRPQTTDHEWLRVRTLTWAGPIRTTNCEREGGGGAVCDSFRAATAKTGSTWRCLTLIRKPVRLQPQCSCPALTSFIMSTMMKQRIPLNF